MMTMIDRPKKKKRAPVKPWQMVAAVLLVLVAAGTLIFVTLLLPALQVPELGSTYHESGDPARQHIEAVLGTTLPEGAANFYFSGVEWMDYSYWIRFNLPAGDFAALLKNSTRLCFTEPLEVNSDGGMQVNGTGLDWWTPDTAASHLSGSCGSNPYYNILVNTGDADTWTVYLNVYST